MEELQDAIEDAQYVNAIHAVEDGPRPVLPWEIPTEEQLAEWKANVLSKNSTGSPEPFGFEWTLSHALGLFLFSAYLKESLDEYAEINFIEEVIRWKQTHGRFRAEITELIVTNYLSPLPKSTTAEVNVPSQQTSATSVSGPENEPSNHDAPKSKRNFPPKTEINEFDLALNPLKFSAEEIQELRSQNSDPSFSKNCLGLDGQVLDNILKKVEKLKNAPGYNHLSSRQLKYNEGGDKVGEGAKESSPESPAKQRSLRHISVICNDLPENLFDQAEAIIAENIREKYWLGFQGSEYHSKLLNFLWFQDRKVVEEDFFVMRVLGRGGFGLVTGKCPVFIDISHLLMKKLSQQNRLIPFQQNW